MPDVYTAESWPTSMYMYIVFFLFLMNYISKKHFENMSDLFLVYCHVKHYFEKDEVIK